MAGEVVKRRDGSGHETGTLAGLAFGYLPFHALVSMVKTQRYRNQREKRDNIKKQASVPGLCAFL